LSNEKVQQIFMGYLILSLVVVAAEDGTLLVAFHCLAAC
jgi:hypothetical protein